MPTTTAPASRRRAARAALALLLAAGTATLAHAQPAATAPEAPAVADTDAAALALADFDRAWELVRDTHFDPTYNGVDWDAVRDELRPQAAVSDSVSARRAVITEMLGRLKQSHFGIIPKEANDRVTTAPVGGTTASAEDTDPTTASPDEDSDGAASPGLDVRVGDDGVLITSVQPDSPAHAAGLRPGDRVTSIAGRTLADILDPIVESVGPREGAITAWQFFDTLLRGAPGSRVRVAGTARDGSPFALKLERLAGNGSEVKFGNLPPIYTELTHRWLDASETGSEDAKVGYIAFNIWMIPIRPAFERAMWELRDADGIVIDVRGNLGGIGGMSGGIAGFFVDSMQSLGTMRTRGSEINFNAQPVRVTSWGEAYQPFTGPVALLIDGVSASTSEIFAAGLKSMGRARLFGQTTAGMALPALMSPLPSGDVLLHAMADFHTPTGEAPEGGGVSPDVAIPLNAATLSEGQDATLTAAARWIVDSHDQPAAD